MERIGGFRSGAEAAVARTALEAHGIAARVVVDEAFGLDPAGKWSACLEVSDDDHEVAVEVLSADATASRVPVGVGTDATTRRDAARPAPTPEDDAPRRWVQHPLVKGVAVLVLVGFLWNWALFLLRVAL